MTSPLYSTLAIAALGYSGPEYFLFAVIQCMSYLSHIYVVFRDRRGGDFYGGGGGGRGMMGDAGRMRAGYVISVHVNTISWL